MNLLIGYPDSRLRVYFVRNKIYRDNIDPERKDMNEVVEWA